MSQGTSRNDMVTQLILKGYTAEKERVYKNKVYEANAERQRIRDEEEAEKRAAEAAKLILF